MADTLDIINSAKNAYYNSDTPILTDEEYDSIVANYGEEPSVGAPVLDNIPKVSISDKPMLSLDKVHTIEEIESFRKDKEIIASIKCDGISVRLIYENGTLVGANTRGNGYIGGDIFSHAHFIQGIPLTIERTTRFIVDGEVIIYKEDFDSVKFKNQRNAAAGALNLLDMIEVSRRHLSFVAWDVILNDDFVSYEQKLQTALALGFNVVPWIKVTSNIQDAIDFCLNKAEADGCPCDGVVFKYNDLTYGDSLGATAHHFRNAIAWKPEIKTYPTRLKYISWTLGRTGVLTPVAVFDPINIDGTKVERASLHNVSIMKEMLGDCAYVGEPLEIYKANMIIPQIYSAGPKYDYGYVIAHGGVSANDNPDHCPICYSHDIGYRKENGIIRLYCDNPQCEGKLINKLDHFCGKKGLDIKGLSKATLEKLIDWNWIITIKDLFTLKDHRAEWISKQGFGVASVDKILKAIEDSCYCESYQFLSAIGIPLVGVTTSKLLMKNFSDYSSFREALKSKDGRRKFFEINGIGAVIIDEIFSFDFTEADEIFEKYITEIVYVSGQINNLLEGKTFVITGKLKEFKNRDDLKLYIENLGGKVSDSVSAKTSYLINNDVNSTSSKNLKAKKLNIPIITEADFLLMTKDKVD